MYIFPRDLYVDVSLEESFDTQIRLKELDLQSQKVRKEKGAFIRVFDGERWYYSSTTDTEHIQAHINALAAMATANPGILLPFGNKRRLLESKQAKFRQFA
ncbi:MAG: hypothetical protein M0R49_04685 [Limnochordia bacterium]|nr:hypothetical protein [Limnochordia bacterium]